MTQSIYHDAPPGTEDARYGGDDGDDGREDIYTVDADGNVGFDQNQLAEALTASSPIDLRFEPIRPCEICGADLETYYHLSDCELSEDVVGVAV